MESPELRIFQMVAREGSITKAAVRLGYVQSNVTARIRQLESELGTVLFLRHNRGMTLSASGKALLAYADKIIGLLDEAAMALHSSSEPSGSLMIGSTQTAAAVRLPALLSTYYAQYPGVLLSLTTGHTQDLMEKVLQFELDGAFIGEESNHPELQSFPVFNEELVIVTSPSVKDMEKAAAKPILVYSKGCSYRVILEKWLFSSGVSHPVIMEFGTLEAIIGGVSAGLGITLMPRIVAQKQIAEGSLAAHPLPSSFNHRKTEFIARKDSYRSGALRAFIEALPRIE
ncbi:LysR family transcriptional regulator [Paenibacillus harenae]|uniref:LysR family transcriptional regulator n=1 Tax=Paenibacillus harenae TaxID=306543 RepID=UPI00041A8035|nr:LysR family transcriptional regulator [Paenibacillus harenae]